MTSFSPRTCNASIWTPAQVSEISAGRGGGGAFSKVHICSALTQFSRPPVMSSPTCAEQPEQRATDFRFDVKLAAQLSKARYDGAITLIHKHIARNDRF
jgi:hypothetical protein